MKKFATRKLSRTTTITCIAVAMLTIPATAMAAFIGGTSGPNTLYGTAGNDVIDGREGNDTLYGFAGNDDLRLGSGGDVAYGGAGDDMIRADTLDMQVDRIYCGPGFDHVDKRPEDWTQTDCELVHVV